VHEEGTEKERERKCGAHRVARQALYVWSVMAYVRERERERARARASEGKRERYRPGRRARPPLLGRGGNLVTKVASQAPGLDHRIIGGGLLRR